MGAIEFVFPADNFGGGEKAAQGREDFWSGPEGEDELDRPLLRVE